MKRRHCCAFTFAALIAFITSGCGSSSVDAAAKWDGKEPLPPIAVKASKNSRKAPQAPPRRVRGFTVPTEQPGV
jgi:hypothetical protein